jgi:uncharacterized protein GlcG (DUF336 family)
MSEKTDKIVLTRATRNGNRSSALPRSGVYLIQQGKPMSTLTLDIANAIIDGAFRKARDLGLAPLAVAVLDEGGHLKTMQRQDGASFMRGSIALAKAWGAIGMGVSSRELGKMAKERPHFMTALTEVADGRLMPVPGGVLIRSADNRIVGAVGISGDLSDLDESCAIAGIDAVGLIPDYGKK